MRISDWSSDVCSSYLHRFGFRVVDVVGDDRAAAGDLVADEFGGDVIGDACAKVLPVTRGGLAALGAAEVFADGDIFHLGRDDAFAGIVHLADVHARPGAQGALNDIGEGIDAAGDRKGGVWGKSVSVRVELGGR